MVQTSKREGISGFVGNKQNLDELLNVSKFHPHTAPLEKVFVNEPQRRSKGINPGNYFPRRGGGATKFCSKRKKIKIVKTLCNFLLLKLLQWIIFKPPSN